MYNDLYMTQMPEKLQLHQLSLQTLRWYTSYEHQENHSKSALPGKESFNNRYQQFTSEVMR
jgi:hypothetical protein